MHALAPDGADGSPAARRHAGSATCLAEQQRPPGTQARRRMVRVVYCHGSRSRAASLHLARRLVVPSILVAQKKGTWNMSYSRLVPGCALIAAVALTACSGSTSSTAAPTSAAPAAVSPVTAPSAAPLASPSLAASPAASPSSLLPSPSASPSVLPSPSVGASPSAAAAAPTSTGGLAERTLPSLGEVLTDLQGYTVYELDSDSENTSTCTGACVGPWPPVLFSGSGTLTGPADLDGTLGTIARPEGTGQQITVEGYPLYHFARDTAPGMATGDGVKAFGGTWHVVDPTDPTP